MVIGIHTVHIRVKVPNLLISSNLRELVGGGLCSKGAERPGKVTIENGTEERCFSSSVSKSRSRRRLRLLHCLRIEQGQNTGLLLCYSDVYVYDVEGCASDLFVLGPGNQYPP